MSQREPQNISDTEVTEGYFKVLEATKTYEYMTVMIDLYSLWIGFVNGIGRPDLMKYGEYLRLVNDYNDRRVNDQRRGSRWEFKTRKEETKDE
jgi:hypothetical protein